MILSKKPLRAEGAKHMKKKLSVLIAGGDYRQTYIAGYFIKYFDKIYTIGFNQTLSFNEITHLEDISDLKDNIDVLVLPPVATNDGVTVNTPFYNKNLYLDTVFDKLCPGAKIFGGNLSDDLSAVLISSGFTVTDYFKNEKLILANTIPTAEGALQLALEETPYVLRGAKTAVMGFGRVGSETARLFKNVGANVFVFDRKADKRKTAEEMGLSALSFDSDKIYSSDIIINTVPALVLTKDILKKLSTDTLIIDLASKPGGVDLSYAKLRGLNVIWALSLPGKVAPVTSGEIIAKTIISCLGLGGGIW